MVEIVENYDYEIILLLQSIMGFSEALDKAITLFASDYLIPVSISLLMIYAWFGAKKPSLRLKNQLASLTAITSLAITNLSILILNHFLFRPRPYDSHNVEVFFYLPTDSSFPANSVAATFALTMPFLFSRIPVGLILVSFSAILGITRILVGIHYPSDILGAMCIATSLSFIITVVFKKFRTRLERMLEFAERILFA